MNRHHFLRLLIVISQLFFYFVLRAQCPTIEAIMIDACGTEQFNEFVVINSGTGFNTSDLVLDYDSNNNFGGGVNNDVNTGANPCGIAAGNAGAYSGCSNLISVGAGYDIPPNSIVVFQASANSGANLYNFSSLCGMGQCVYVVSSSCARGAGAFTNGGGSGTRTTIFTVNACTQTITYNLGSFPASNGQYYLPATNTYGNMGCVVPPSSPAPMGATVNQPNNVVECANNPVSVIFTGTGSSYNWTNNNTNIGLGASGTGDINFNAANVSSTQVATITVTPIGSCPGPSKTFTITINPGPVANTPANVTVCAGTVVNVPLTGSPAGTTYSWTNDNPAIGLGASGSGNINFTSANVSMQEVATITVTPQNGTCPGTPVTFNITINPRPTADDPPNQSVCGGDPVSVPLTGTPAGLNLNWTNSNPAIGLGTSGSGDINFTANNVGGITTSIVTVTPSLNGCTGPAQTFNITVNPSPTVNQPNNVTLCGGGAVNVPFTGSPAGVSYTWTNDNPAIGLAASGSGNINFTSLNPGNQEVANITVTPQSGVCTGTPKTFTITINPTPVVDDPANLAVCGGEQVDVTFTGTPAGGTTYNWVNSNPSIGLSASGNGDISFVSATTSGIISGTITVTPVAGTCTGATQNFVVTVTPTPNANQPADVTVCGGTPVSIPFTGTPPGATYNWTNDNTAIGLGASGVGNINFTAATVSNQEIANITLTPQFGICAGQPRTFTIIINPLPTFNDPADQNVCAGEAVSVAFTGAPGGTNFSWTNSNPAIGLGASGTGNISFTAANVASNQTATITVSPNIGGCPGIPQTFTITVAPAPALNQPGNVTVCAGAPVSVPFSGSPAGVVFNWTNDNPNIGLAAAGTGNINFTSASVTMQEVANITVTPQFGACPGTPRTFTITINPTPVANDPADQTVCAGSPVSIPLTGTPAGASFNWTNNNPAIGLGASGTGNINFTAANVASNQTGVITVTPSFGVCTGTAQTFTISVAPAPSLTQPNNVTVCGGAAVAVPFSGIPAGVVFDWTNDNPNIGLAGSGTGNINFTSANVNTQEVANITVTPQFGACPGTPRTFTITVKPAAVVNQPADVLVCGNQPISIAFSGTPAGLTYNWTNSNTGIGLPATGSGNINYTSPNVGSTSTGVIVVTPTANGCPGTPVSFNITIESQPSLTNPGNQTFCGNQVVNLLFTGSATTYTWINNNPSIGLPSSGTGNLAFTSANVSSSTTATIQVTPQIGTCTGAPVIFNITINPTPQLSQPANLTVCSNNVLQIDFSGNQTGTTFTWTNDNTAIGLGASGSGSINFMAANVPATLVGNVSVTPVLGACNGTALDFSITVQPAPTVSNPGDQTVCGNNQLDINFTAAPGAILDWTNSNTGIGLPAAGTGNISFVSANVAANVSGVITVIPTLAGCTGPAQSFSVNVVTQPTVANPGTVNACANTPVAVNFGNGSTMYNWTNSNPAIGLAATGTGNLNFTAANVTSIETAQITITPVLGTCTGASEVFNLNINPTPVVAISGITKICQGDGTTLTATGGISYNWSGGQTGNSITLVPNSTSTYGVIATDAAGCTAVSNTTVTVNPTYFIQKTASSCLPADTGVVVKNYLSVLGCDSTEIVTTTLLPSYAINLIEYTCNPAQAGVTVKNLKSIFNCDSIVTRTVIYDPSNIDTTITLKKTCNPALVGDVAVVNTGADGCDSVAITRTLLSPSNTVNVSKVTCKPAEAGVFTKVLVNVFGCDSTVVETVTFDPTLIKTTSKTAKTCNPANVGVSTQTLTAYNGCDSIVVTTTTLAPSYNLSFSEVTCHPNLAGVFTQNLLTQYGCDSILIKTVTFDPSLIDSTFQTAQTCNPAQVGKTTKVLVGANGCDSLIITNTTLAPPITNTVTEYTCKPNNAGSFIQTFNANNGCDSVVTRIIIYNPALIDTTLVPLTTCDPMQAGTIVQTLVGKDGCDSVVIRKTVYDPALCAPSALTSIKGASCAEKTDGSVTITPTAGTGPFQYTWIDGKGNSGSGTINNLNTAATITGMAPGPFSIQIKPAIGLPLDLSGTISAPPPLSALSVPLNLYNGFGVRCTGGTDGSIACSVSGGTGPFRYKWNTGDTLSTINNLAGGDYSVTITDKNGCQISAFSSLTAPDPLNIILKLGKPECGAQTVDLNITPIGGVQLYNVYLDGSLLGSTPPTVASGQHTVLVQDANDCVSDSTFTLDVPESGIIFLPADTTVVLGTELSIEAQTNLDVWRSISWSPLPDSTCPQCLKQTWTPFKSAVYTVTQVDTFGCVSKASMRVRVKKGSLVYVPNVFSPDNLNDNDFFTIGAAPGVESMDELRIFDRWGDAVYILEAPVHPNEWPGWDGRVGGKTVSVGVYVYYLKIRLVTGETETISGDLTVIKN